MTKRAVWFLLLAVTVASEPGVAQGIVVDEGQFEISVDGRAVGLEDFVIRRAGLGRDNAVFANAVVTLAVGGERQEIHPLLSAEPPFGTASAYQVRVTGPYAMELRLNRAGGRSNSGEGGEDEARWEPITDADETGHSPTFPHLRGLRNGDIAVSKVKQIASGRFGVTPAYLMSAEQIEIKDASKASKDKTESVKITLLNTELNRASQKPEFLSYFSEVSCALLLCFFM